MLAFLECRQAAYVAARHTLLLALQTIVEADCIIRGDLANVKVGRFTLIGEGTVIRPAAKLVQDKGEVVFLPLTIDEHVTIGKRCLINATVIGKFVDIGNNCVIVSAPKCQAHFHSTPGHTAISCTLRPATSDTSGLIVLILLFTGTTVCPQRLL